VALDEIRGALRAGIGHRRAAVGAAHHAAQPEAIHQALHRAARHGDPLPRELFPDLVGTVARPLLAPHPYDLRAQRSIALLARRESRRVCLPSLLFVVRRRSDRQLGADRLDSVRLPVRVNERHHQLPRRSSSAWAKYADALRRMSLARRSSRFSRSTALSCCCAAVVSPGRWPVSRSAWRIQFRSVSLEQPIFSAIEPMALHWEGYSWAWSCTIRIARARTSGENLLCRGMTPTSQGMESPAIPGRFRLTGRR